ncbi:helix-turn-helix domain-containing protein [Microbulbifer halophilus]|uniref:Helix-turn-helix domain-containing protein n=1 Tax=Microbulbifer halophilus TaxID=453963 RepID=A0ABW5EA47_9GAMM|nr:helix-turn-helix transcriptional regulator [Microbulbifer halophilus]MCW8127138.1 helix-turn-helix transcriptional regulator [Microbulbifer halophilus]
MAEQQVMAERDRLLTQIGDHVRHLRLSANISQEELAATSGVGLSTLKRLERGEGCNLAALLQVLEPLDAAGKLEAFFARLAGEVRTSGPDGERRRASSLRRPATSGK